MRPQAFTPGNLAGWVLSLFCLTGCLGCHPWQKRSSVVELEQARELSFSGIHRSQQGDWEGAERFFREAAEVCPQDERAHAHLSEALWNQGRLAEAIDVQREAVVRSGGDPRQHIQLGKLLLEQGKLDDAAAQADLAIEKNRKSTDAWNLRGSIQIAQGRLSEALASLHRSQAIDPKQRWVHEQLAWIYERQQRPQRALATWYALEELYAVDDVPAHVLYRQALALRALSRPTQALARLQQARDREPDSAEILLALADLQLETGDASNALLTLNEASKKWPNDSRFTSRLAETRSRSEGLIR